MKKQLFLLAIVATTAALADDVNDDSIESVLPPLTPNQRRALDQFADHKVFAEAWKQATHDLHERYKEIREKSHNHVPQKGHHHRKIRKVVYVDEDAPGDAYDVPAGDM